MLIDETGLLPNYLQNLIKQLESLPGIGHKSAQRIALHLLANTELIDKTTDSLNNTIDQINKCSVCGIYTEKSKTICKNCREESLRNKNQIIVVSTIIDVIAIENSQFDGVYHILGGNISPQLGVDIEDLNINSLIKRIKDSKLDNLEIILALNPNVEGETTALYIKNLLRDNGLLDNIKLCKLGYGLAVGSDLEYTDKHTIIKALENRNLF